MNGAVKWSDESTREFIQLRYKLRHLLNGRKHHCEKAYSRIVEELGLTHVITPTQARKKWSNLLQKYMDIKGGYSTATPDWPYFQILDQVVPLMRKEKIEKLPSSSVDSRDLYDDLHSPLTTPSISEKDPLTSTSDSLATSANSVTPQASSSVMASSKCKTEAVDESEPPRKRGRGRRAAQRARDRWWGAVEDDDLGSDLLGKGDYLLTSTGGGGASRTPVYNVVEPTRLELQTCNMLESCSTALGEIKNVLTSHTSHQEALMQNLQQTVVSQGNTVKDLLTTLTSQNATLISLISQLTTKASQHSSLVVGSDSASYNEQKHQGEGKPQPHSHSSPTTHQLHTSQSNLISALSQDSQDSDNALVDNPELADNMAECGKKEHGQLGEAQ